MEGVSIRPMVSGDFPAFDRFGAALHALHQQARPDLFAPCRHLFTQEGFEGMLGGPGQILLIAEDGDGAVGICAAERKQPPPRAAGSRLAPGQREGGPALHPAGVAL